MSSTSPARARSSSRRQKFHLAVLRSASSGMRVCLKSDATLTTARTARLSVPQSATHPPGTSYGASQMPSPHTGSRQAWLMSATRTYVTTLCRPWLVMLSSSPKRRTCATAACVLYAPLVSVCETK
ncbi:hypothetical protein NFJ02_16g23030 [Pycnococcus provasolii]